MPTIPLSSESRDQLLLAKLLDHNDHGSREVLRALAEEKVRNLRESAAGLSAKAAELAAEADGIAGALCDPQWPVEAEVRAFWAFHLREMFRCSSLSNG